MSDPVIEKVVPGFTALKTAGKLFVKSFEFIHKIFDIALAKVEP